jgi:hypothetical protein
VEFFTILHKIRSIHPVASLLSPPFSKALTVSHLVLQFITVFLFVCLVAACSRDHHGLWTDRCRESLPIFSNTLPLFLIPFSYSRSFQTYTMVGSEDAYEYRGVIPRAISDVFREIESRPDTQFIVRVSYFEIYNETIRDLIADVCFFFFVPVFSLFSTLFRRLSLSQKMRSISPAIYR